MKIRNGFVSNSSSSSFIIGIAKIKDEEKFNKWTKKNKIVKDEYDLYVGTPKEFKEKFGNDGYSHTCFRIKDDIIYNTAAVNSEPEVLMKVEDNEKYVVFNYGNDEGDDAFWDGDDLDYDIDENWFEGYQYKVLQELMKKDSELFEKTVYSFGADRNG